MIKKIDTINCDVDFIQFNEIKKKTKIRVNCSSHVDDASCEINHNQNVCKNNDAKQKSFLKKIQNNMTHKKKEKKTLNFKF